MSGPSHTEWQAHWTRLDHTADLEPARRWRHRLIEDLAWRLGPTSVLDLGCGRGEVLERLSRFPTVRYLVGVDGAESPRLAGLENVRRVRADLEGPRPTWPTEVATEKGFDLVVASEVLEHLDDDVATLRRVVHVLAPKGRIVLTLPGGPRGHLDRHFGHRRHYDARAITRLLDAADLVPVDIRAHGFPFFNIYRLGIVIGGAYLTHRVLDTTRSRPRLWTRSLFVAFDRLLRFELPRRRWGWQFVVVATPRRAAG